MIAQDDPITAAELAAFDVLAADAETRRYPYGRPAQDTGWYWEDPIWGLSA